MHLRFWYYNELIRLARTKYVLLTWCHVPILRQFQLLPLSRNYWEMNHHFVPPQKKFNQLGKIAAPNLFPSYLMPYARLDAAAIFIIEPRLVFDDEPMQFKWHQLIGVTAFEVLLSHSMLCAHLEAASVVIIEPHWEMGDEPIQPQKKFFDNINWSEWQFYKYLLSLDAVRASYCSINCHHWASLGNG